MEYISRVIELKINQYLQQGRSILLLGPRQTGKTTLIKRLPAALSISFIQPRVRLRYEKDPSLLADEIEALSEDSKELPLVVIDEVQKVPMIMDVVQDLIDRKIANFILTGSSARKLKRGNDINLLPGRVVVLHLDPLLYTEMLDYSPSIEDLLIYGALPGIIFIESATEREEILTSYVSTYLEEEIRAEALVRKLSSFAKFLELAASESGRTVNYSKLSQEIGVAHTTIMAYYQILEDCLIVERVEPYIISKTRKKMSKSPKYLFFDMGVRRVAANEGTSLPLETMGYLFEQYVGIELIHQIRFAKEKIKLQYWRDHDGPEVDWVIHTPNKLIPIEVKWTTTPNQQDTRHIETFLNEYKNAEQGYVVCRVPRKLKIKDNIYAIPWQDIHELLAE